MDKYILLDLNYDVVSKYEIGGYYYIHRLESEDADENRFFATRIGSTYPLYTILEDWTLGPVSLEVIGAWRPYTIKEIYGE